jgi:cell division protein FtsL
MAQQRLKEQRSEVRLATAVKAILICLLIGGVAIGYVLQSHENLRLNEELGTLEREHQKLKAESHRLENQLQDLHAPANIERMVVAHGLDLVRSRPGQVVVLRGLEYGSSMMAQGRHAPGQAMSSGRLP